VARPGGPRGGSRRASGARVGASDWFVPAMLRPAAITAWQALHPEGGRRAPQPHPAMPPVLAVAGRQTPPPGYRPLGQQAIRLDMAEKLLHAAHQVRVRAGHKRTRARDFVLDPALAVSMGLGTPAYAHLLRLGGFQAIPPRPLPEGAFGPPALPRWRWRPPRRQAAEPRPAALPPNSAFAALAGMIR